LFLDADPRSRSPTHRLRAYRAAAVELLQQRHAISARQRYGEVQIARWVFALRLAREPGRRTREKAAMSAASTLFTVTETTRMLGGDLLACALEGRTADQDVRP
jgi:hypothetical protein